MNKLRSLRFAMGIYFMVMSLVLVVLVLGLWYTKIDSNGAIPKLWNGSATLYVTDYFIHYEFRLILLVLLTGALGSFVHAATSFATYVGNRSLVDSWNWWYVLRPFIGMALALIFYFAIRGGLLLLTSEGALKDINPYGIAAISGLVGMFSKQATDKLRELFDNLFKTEKGKGDEERANKLGEMRPVRDVMLGINRITGCHIEKGKTEKDVTIEELYHFLKGVVTRIPIFDDKDAVKYVIHQSMLYKFISEMSIKAAGKTFNISDLTLDDFLSFNRMKELVKESIAFIPIEATLGDGKKEMEQTKNCQDVFITENGKKEEPALGWLTNIEISKHMKA